ncbi:hypothetical protein LTR37_015733 [Vermiconidia calcicola]|uniref:Uncharacterized protein n=1 Tax=Vermiconidia calcicola TaxID=1690605 RepID=A0ACC3MR41_9PEZI|nr:hypothetical protein LTR37_015733 [Vermiconidia calcicola]
MAGPRPFCKKCQVSKDQLCSDCSQLKQLLQHTGAWAEEASAEEDGLGQDQTRTGPGIAPMEARLLTSDHTSVPNSINSLSNQQNYRIYGAATNQDYDAVQYLGSGTARRQPSNASTIAVSGTTVAGEDRLQPSMSPDRARVQREAGARASEMAARLRSSKLTDNKAQS